MTNKPDAMDDLQTVEMRAASLVTVKTQKDRACGSNGCDASGTLGHLVIHTMPILLRSSALSLMLARKTMDDAVRQTNRSPKKGERQPLCCKITMRTACC